MKNVAALSRAALERATLKADAEARAICAEMIAAGRGHELPSETRKKTDPLSLRYIASANLCVCLYGEARSRMEYHGKLTPIKRA
jgi:hypothetical protein